MRTILAAGLLCVCAAVSAASAAAAPAGEAPQPVPIDAATWKLTEGAKIETYLGRPALRLRTGEAVAQGVSFLDGTLEFDIAVGTHRNFPIVMLRRQGPGEYEEFYLRTHKSELPDAIQYVPAWQGVGGWQLYHGPGFTAKAPFPRDQWFPVRIVLSATHAAVFVGNVAQPQLVVERLRREPKAGGLAFENTSPAGAAPEGDWPTAISNVVLRPGWVPYDFSKSTIHENPPPKGAVAEWELSEAFVPGAGPILTLPERIVRGKWQKVPAEPSGLVVLERYVPVPDAERRAALARLVIDAPADGVRRFDFGYSDEVTVFLDGRPLFSGDAHYSFDNPRQEGLIGFWQGTLYLPLKKGRNELVLALSEVFGGWGVMGRWEP